MPSSNSSLSFKARELKFLMQTSHINAKKVTTRFLNFCPVAEIWSKNCQNFTDDSQRPLSLIAYTILKLRS